jgi:hypothetical protein
MFREFASSLHFHVHVSLATLLIMCLTFSYFRCRIDTYPDITNILYMHNTNPLCISFKILHKGLVILVYSLYTGTQNTQNYKIVTAKQATAIHNFFYLTEVTNGNDNHNKNYRR